MVRKALSYRAGNLDLENDKALILAPTGVAAVNVEGNTFTQEIHSALGISADRSFA